MLSLVYWMHILTLAGYMNHRGAASPPVLCAVQVVPVYREIEQDTFDGILIINPFLYQNKSFFRT